MTTFCNEAWLRNAGLIESIEQHAFNRELAASDLAPDRFQRYVIQDSLYLKRYGQVLALCGAKASTQEDLAFFTASAGEAIRVEQSMHGDFLDQFGVSAAELADAKPSPVCRAYTDFLLASAWGEPYPVAVAATLPCFWVYGHIGRNIARRTVDNNRYRAWIDTYSDPGFAQAVEQIKTITDRVAAEADQATIVAMHEAFRLSTLYEYMFWDSAYAGADWPLMG